jgi:tetratricopeptide (TPR) repeat protein
MSSHSSTVICLLAALLCVSTACAVKPGAGSPAASAENRLVLDSLPTDSEGLVSADLTPELLRGWDVLRAGGFTRAAGIFDKMLDGTPTLSATESAAAFSGQGFARLGLGHYPEADRSFAGALAAEPQYGPALLGEALRQRLLGRADKSIALYETLSRRYPQNARISLEAETARLEAVVQAVRRAGALLDSDPEAAAVYYRQAIGWDPDLPQLHGLLAGALQASGRFDEALESLERALSLSTGEEALAYRQQLAWLELEHGRPEHAVSLFQSLLAADTGKTAEFQEGLIRAEEKLRDASIPGEYRQLLAGRIPLDRGGLAAIIAMEYQWGSGETSGNVARQNVIRDAAPHWSQVYIRAVVDHGVMDLYQNHTFRPAGPVSRGDLAFAGCRLLQQFGDAGVQETETMVFPDLSRDHRHHQCISQLVSLGLVNRFPDDTIRINTPATAADALELISALHRMFPEPEQ